VTMIQQFDIDVNRCGLCRVTAYGDDSEGRLVSWDAYTGRRDIDPESLGDVFQVRLFSCRLLSSPFPSHAFSTQTLQLSMHLFSPQDYGHVYDPKVFEPRRWIERPGGVGEIWEGHPAFGFGRRYVTSFPVMLISLPSVISMSFFYVSSMKLTDIL
jgi:hypothetical protein